MRLKLTPPEFMDDRVPMTSRVAYQPVNFSNARRDLHWELVEREHALEGETGKQTLLI